MPGKHCPDSFASGNASIAARLDLYDSRMNVQAIFRPSEEHSLKHREKYRRSSFGQLDVMLGQGI
jgi:hypothetical protein